MLFFKKRNKNVPPIYLSQLFSDLRKTIIDHQQKLHHQQVEQLNKLIDDDGEPRYKLIKVDGGQSVKVPLINLVNTQLLSTEEVKFTVDAPLSKRKYRQLEKEKMALGLENILLKYTKKRFRRGSVNLSIIYRSNPTKLVSKPSDNIA